MVLGNKCDMEDRRAVTKDRGTQVKVCLEDCLWGCTSRALGKITMPTSPLPRDTGISQKPEILS